MRVFPQLTRCRVYISYPCLQALWRRLAGSHSHALGGEAVEGILPPCYDEALPETTDPEMEITYVDIGNVDSVGGITGTEDLVFEDAPSRARQHRSAGWTS